MTDDPHQWKNVAGNGEFSAARSQLRKWLPKKNAPHYRGSK